MSISVTFEARDSRDLFKQIAEFIENGAVAVGKPTVNIEHKVASVVREAAAEAKNVLGDVANTSGPPTPPYEDAPPPTPAVLALLKEQSIPESLWGSIPRTGKGNRMTQGDVKKFAKDHVDLAKESQTGQDDTQVEKAPPKDLDTRTPSLETGLDDLKAGLQKVYDHGAKLNPQGGGREWAFALLSRFGVQRITNLEEDQYADFLAKADAAAAGTYDPRGAA